MTSTNLSALTADQLAVGYTLAHARAISAQAGSLARTRATNRAARFSNELFNRGFRLVKAGDGYYYDRF